MREAESTEKVNVTSLKTSMENVTVFCAIAVPWEMASTFWKCCPQITEQLIEERPLKMLPVLVITSGKHS